MQSDNNSAQLFAPEPIRDPAKQLTVLSFGAGQDSTALLCLYIFDPEFRARFAPGRFMVVMSDTGNEHPETYEHVEHVKALCAEHNITFEFLTSDRGYHRGNWQSLKSFYRATNTCGSKAFLKSCTDQLKIGPIYRFLSDWCNRDLGIARPNKEPLVEFALRYGRINVLLGIAAGEEKRVDDSPSRHKWFNQAIRKSYPLIDLSMDRARCQEYIALTGQPVPIPSNCRICPYLDERELLLLFVKHPEDYAEWVELEQAKFRKFAHKGEKNYGVWPKKTLSQKLAEAQERYGDMSLAELEHHRFSHGHCTTQRF